MKQISSNKVYFGVMLFLILTIPFSFAVWASVPDNTNQEISSMRWGNFYKAECHLNINNGFARIEGEAKINSSTNSIINIYLELQKQAINGNWLYIKSYKDTGINEAKILDRYKLHQRGNYRIVMTAVADGEGAETKDCSDYASY